MSSGNKKPRPFAPSPRDLQLLYGLWQARYATTTQLAALFWRGGEVSALRAAQRRLRQMEAVNLVRRVEPWIKKSQGSRPFIYSVGAQAPALLSQAFGLDLATIDWKPKTSLENNFLFLDHLLATNDFQIAVTLACEQYGLHLAWTDEKTLKRQEMRDYVKLTDPSGKEQPVAVIPDSFFVLQAAQGTGHFCVEIDRGTVTVAPQAAHRGWTQKIRAYLAYYASGAYERRYGTRSFRVLTLTTSEERLQHMKAATEAVGGKGKFWFTTFEHVVRVAKVAIKQSATDPTQYKYVYLPHYNAHLLTEPVWYRAGSEQVHRLLE